MWDILGPLFLLVFIGLVVWAVFGYMQKDLYPLIVGGIAEILICSMLGSSIGVFILIIPLTQFGLAGFIVFNKVKKLHESTEP